MITIFTGGMNALFYVDDCSPGTIRQYFIAAEEEEWNYGPSGKNLNGKNLTAPGR